MVDEEKVEQQEAKEVKSVEKENKDLETIKNLQEELKFEKEKSSNYQKEANEYKDKYIDKINKENDHLRMTVQNSFDAFNSDKNTDPEIIKSQDPNEILDFALKITCEELAKTDKDVKFPSAERLKLAKRNILPDSGEDIKKFFEEHKEKVVKDYKDYDKIINELC